MRFFSIAGPLDLSLSRQGSVQGDKIVQLVPISGFVWMIQLHSKRIHATWWFLELSNTNGREATDNLDVLEILAGFCVEARHLNRWVKLLLVINTWPQPWTLPLVQRYIEAGPLFDDIPLLKVSGSSENYWVTFNVHLGQVSVTEVHGVLNRACGLNNSVSIPYAPRRSKFIDDVTFAHSSHTIAESPLPNHYCIIFWLK